MSRSLERPFTPSDVFSRRRSKHPRTPVARPASQAFERRRTPRHCYERLMACHAAAAKKIAKHGETSTAMRVVPAEVVPGDVYDIATLVLGEVALMHSLTANAPAVYAFESNAEGHWLPGARRSARAHARSAARLSAVGGAN